MADKTYRGEMLAWCRDSTEGIQLRTWTFFAQESNTCLYKNPYCTLGAAFSGDRGTQSYIRSVNNGISGGTVFQCFLFPSHILPE